MSAPRTRLVLVRHGRTAWNADGRFQGRADIPLDATGEAQALRMAPYVAGFGPARIVSSDLARARRTAEAIAAASGLEVETDAGLREVDVGSWQGRTLADVSAEEPWFPDALRAGRDFRRSPTGETATEAGERARAVLERLSAERPGETTVVVGHGLALRVGLSLFLGLGFDGSLALSGLWNCSWSVLEQRDRWRILHYNAVADFVSGSPVG